MLQKTIVLSFFAVVSAAPSNHHELRSNLEIVGGNVTDIESIPYQLQLELNGSFICGASLIAPNWAVTAAHCTDPNIAKKFTIRAGSSKSGSGGQVVKVLKQYQHKLYNETTIDYDIALVELEKNVTLDKTVQPIPLVEANKSYKNGTNCTISGWGYTKQRLSLTDLLRSAFVPIVDHKVCNDAYKSIRPVTDRMLCAGFLETGGVDSCEADAGGPLVIDGKLTGIVSWGKGCARKGYPRVYTDVSSVKEFIKEITGL